MTADTTRDDWMVATLRSHPLLASLDEHALRSLVTSGTSQTLRAKKTFLRHGTTADNVYFLLTGAVRVYHANTKGSEVLLKLLKAPAMFGEIEVIAKRRYVENVTTVTPSQVLVMPAAMFRVLLARNPHFSSAVLDDVADRFCVAAENIKAIAFGDVRARLASVLLDYFTLGGATAAGGGVIEVSVSQQSLARDLGVSRKAVQSALATFQRRGLVRKRTGRYVIADASTLEAEAGLRPGLAYSSKTSLG